VKIQKLISVTSIFCGLLFSVYGQQDKCYSTIRSYNKYINLAELAITDSAYKKAGCFYDTAFVIRANPFAKDLYNAAVCNALLNEYSKCNAKLLTLLEKGLDTSVVADNIAFRAFLNSKEGRKILKEPVVPAYNTHLRHIYDSLQIADQYFRNKKPREYMKFYGDTVCAIDASNVKYMNKLILTYGWPSEDLIGIMNLNQQPFDIIITHQGYGAPCRIYDYNRDIRNAYENGQVSVQRAAYLILRTCEKDDLGLSACGIVTVVYDSTEKFKGENLDEFLHKTGFYSLSDQNMKKINASRSEFGLEPIADLRRKLLFNLKDMRFHFSSYGGNSMYDVTTKAEYDNQIKNIVSY
jgi:hypothetical protein